jgi:hypothetical protein
VIRGAAPPTLARVNQDGVGTDRGRCAACGHTNAIHANEVVEGDFTIRTVIIRTNHEGPCVAFTEDVACQCPGLTLMQPLITNVPAQTFESLEQASQRLIDLHDEALFEFDRAFDPDDARRLITVLVNDGSGPFAVIAQVVFHDGPAFEREHPRNGRPPVRYNLNYRHALGAVHGQWQDVDGHRFVHTKDASGISVTWISDRSIRRTRAEDAELAQLKADAKAVHERIAKTDPTRR